MSARTGNVDDTTIEAERLRPRLFGIAYRMLGSVVDAEDAVQEAHPRWAQARAQGTDVESTEAWLVADPASDAEEAAELSESLSLAFLVLLERLSPGERAVFLLREVFGYPFAEIAPDVGNSEAACRQLAKRARERVGMGRPRLHTPAEAGERMAEEFLRACVEGDLPALLALLTEEVELVADCGGLAIAARKPIRGADLVGRFLIGIARLGPRSGTASPATVNGGPGLIARDANGRPVAVMALEPTGNRIKAVRIVVNPNKPHGVPDGHETGPSIP